MTFYEYWDRLVKKMPQLQKADSKMTMTVEGFRDMMLLSFCEGAKSGPEATSKAAADFGDVGKQDIPDPLRVFGEMFGL